MRANIRLAMIAALTLSACAPGQENANEKLVAATPPPPNFIVMIGDDMSVETLSCFGVGKYHAVTPNLDRLCAQSRRFNNFWAQPVCSPTRATILSGRYGFRTKVGTPTMSRIAPMPLPQNPGFASLELRKGSPRPPAGLSAPAPGLSLDEFTLPMALKSDAKLNYETAAFGKWHLGDPANGDKDHPNRAGFDYYRGNVRGGGVESYFAWSEVINGEITEGRSGWADSAKVDDALDWISQRSNDRPFLLWMAFNAPHTPFHKPPADLLHSRAKYLDPNGITLENQHAYFYAMIEAMDTEIGRLLNSLSRAELDNTYIIFLGDNGTPEQVAIPPFGFDHAKGSLAQGGLNVPLMIAGPGIEPGSTLALANSVDIYATIIDLAGIDLDAAIPADIDYDSVSLKSVLEDRDSHVRDFAYADLFGVVPRGIVSEKAIRNQSHKYILMTDGQEKLIDLGIDPYEQRDLMTAEISKSDRAQLTDLRTKLKTLIASEKRQKD